MVSDEEHFDPSESILKDSLNTIKSEMDLPNECMFVCCETIIELKGKPVKIPVLGKGELGEISNGFNWLSTILYVWDNVFTVT